MNRPPDDHDQQPPKRPARPRTPTRTSDFGTSGRINHDSSPFYASRLYTASKVNVPAPPREGEVALPEQARNRIFLGSSTHMRDLPDNCVHLMVTSPPYNVGKAYDQDLTLRGYKLLLKRVLAEVYRVLVPGGRACVNVANLGRRPYIPLHRHIIEIAEKIGFLMRGEIIWDKGAGAGPSTAWGSWMSPANPTLRDVHEYILVFCKGSFRRDGHGRERTITKDEFLDYTKSVWKFASESARKVGHPAPFPVELPRRLIQLYTFKGDVVLDPFMGSGSTAVAAVESDRVYVGYEINEDYVKIALERVLRAAKPTSAGQSMLPIDEQPSPHPSRNGVSP